MNVDFGRIARRDGEFWIDCSRSLVHPSVRPSVRLSVVNWRRLSLTCRRTTAGRTVTSDYRLQKANIEFELTVDRTWPVRRPIEQRIHKLEQVERKKASHVCIRRATTRSSNRSVSVSKCEFPTVHLLSQCCAIVLTPHQLQIEQLSSANPNNRWKCASN